MAKPLFTPMQEQFINKNAKGRSAKELADLINKTFELSITDKQMRQFKANRKILGGHNKPIGTETIIHGYVMVKVSYEGAYEDRWKFKHKVIWEKANGPIPTSCALLFADQNKLNVTLDNLVLITKKQLGMLNKHQLLNDDKDLNQTAINIADLLLSVANKKKVVRKNGKTQKNEG